MDTIIIIIIILSILISIYQIPSIKGFVGEKLVSIILKSFIKDSGYLFNDYLFDMNNNSCQIDHILLTKKGIFIVETKNYSGVIYGYENSQKFYQYLNNGKIKNEFYSPLKQNETHINKIKKILNNNINVYGIVCFIKNNFKNKDIKNIVSIFTLKKYIKSFKNDCLTIDELNEYNDILLNNNESNFINNLKHIKRVKNKKNNINKLICPVCGANLILKKGNYGNFYGCQNYPNCLFTLKKE